MLCTALLQQTMQGLHQRFGQAKEVMKWLTESARAISATGQPVTWTTPLGLPVVQPYRKKVWQRTASQRPELLPIALTARCMRFCCLIVASSISWDRFCAVMMPGCHPIAAPVIAASNDAKLQRSSRRAVAPLAAWILHIC